MRTQLPKMTHAERVARAQEKTTRLLKFLGSGEVFTTATVCAELLQIDRSRATACLKSLEAQGSLKSEVHDVRARSVKIYGTTPHGLAIADCCGNPYLELGRTNGAQIEHRLCGQRMRIRAEAAGWTDWTPERALRLLSNLKKIPDAVVTDPGGNRIALEIERHIKTPKRYAELIVAYLQEIKAGKYSEVHYVCPPGVERLVKGTFERIESVRFNGESVTLEKKHREKFKFYSFDNWLLKPKITESEGEA